MFAFSLEEINAKSDGHSTKPDGDRLLIPEAKAGTVRNQTGRGAKPVGHSAEALCVCSLCGIT